MFKFNNKDIRTTLSKPSQKSKMERFAKMGDGP